MRVWSPLSGGSQPDRLPLRKLSVRPKRELFFTVAPFETSRLQERERAALLVQLAFTAEDNMSHRSVEIGVFLEGEENSGSKIKRSLSLIFHNCVLFSRFYSCNILSVWPGPS